MSISNVNGALVTYQYEGKAQKTSAQETPFFEKVTGTEGAASTQELSDAEKLENFKKEIWDEINSFSWNKSMNISIQITDGAFKRMMEDSDFKDRMLNVIQKESIAAQPPGNVSLTWIDESGYKGYSYLDNDAGAIEFKAHSNGKDAFYVKKATKGQDYTELWEERRFERERQREKLDKEYVDKLYLNRILLRKEQASATAINSTQYEQKNNETSSARNKDSVEISQSGRLAATFDLDEDTANRIETAIQNADIPALLEEFKEKKGSLPVDEEWHYRKIVDPDGKIYSLTYVESLVRQYLCEENTIKAYYAEAHQDNLSKGSISAARDYISLKYTEFGLLVGSPYYRADMSEAERKMAFEQETALLLGGSIALGDPYALASSGGTINIKDADQIAHQAARDRIDELINEYKRANGIA